LSHVQPPLRGNFGNELTARTLVRRLPHNRLLPMSATMPPSIADAYAGNRLLATFPDDLKAMIEARSKWPSSIRRTVLRRGTGGPFTFPFAPP
jgi:hypothetical protein